MNIILGQKWRDMRGTLSPAFTSSKMRQMFVHVAECGEQMANHYLQEIKSKNNGLFNYLNTFHTSKHSHIFIIFTNWKKYFTYSGNCLT